MEGQPSLEFIKKIARQAGDITLQYFQKTFESWEKSENRGIVTEADLASEKFLKEAIQKAFPAHTILAEESGWTDLRQGSPQGDKPIWFIDPIDGTTNYSRGNPYYCVSVAFGYQRPNGFCEMELGVVYQPPTGHMFSAERGKGALWGERRLHLARTEDFRKGLFSTGIGSQTGADLVPLFETMRAVQDQCATSGVRINGAAALDLALTAAGVFHGFWEKSLNPWDTAAGQLLVREAGGSVRSFSGQDYDTLRDPGIIAGNSGLIDRLVGLVSIK